MTKCPACNTDGAIILFRTVECASPKCKWYSVGAERASWEQAAAKIDAETTMTPSQTLKGYWYTGGPLSP